MPQYSTSDTIRRDEYVKTPKELAHEQLVDELIAAGWSDVPQDQIPDNWRELKAPRKVFGRRRAK